MTPFVADENFNGNVINALRRRHPEVDLVTVQELEMSGATDPEVLEWAAQHKRLVVSNDVRTMTERSLRSWRSSRTVPNLTSGKVRSSSSRCNRCYFSVARDVKVKHPFE